MREGEFEAARKLGYMSVIKIKDVPAFKKLTVQKNITKIFN